MANKKASKQDIKRITRNTKRNNHFKTMLKTSLRHALEGIATGGDQSIQRVRAACRLIDKVASKGIIKKPTAARKKSRLVKRYNQSVAAR